MGEQNIKSVLTSELNQPRLSWVRKPGMAKWILVVIIIIAIAGPVLYSMALKEKAKEKEESRQQMSGFAKTMSAEQRQKAEKALQNGIKIEDAKGDFVSDFKLIMPADQILQFDTKSIEYGADDQYLYRKCSYRAVAEENLVLAGHGDIQMNCSSALYIDRQQPKAVKWGEEKYHMLTTNYDYAENLLGIELSINMPEGATEEDMNNSGVQYSIKRPFGGLVYGGVGYDYVLAAWPLSELGLKSDDAVTIFSSTEEGAKGDGTHFAVDMVPQGNQKDGTMVKWVLGQKEYQIIKEKQ
jgi:hypothetical protein